MKKIYIFSAVLDGLIYGNVLNILLDFIISPYAQTLSFSDCIYLTTVCSTLVSIASLFLMWKVKNNKSVLLSFLISFTASVVIFALGIVLPFSLFNAESHDNQGGLFIFIVLSVFVFLSFIFKLFFTLLLFVRNSRSTGEF
ncbi:MAG: hypothetical protein IKL04_08865 [Lachnospiraceae bacterium]|nr:hypothetical protein [Lachnospiraceae bacterium]